MINHRIWNYFFIAEISWPADSLTTKSEDMFFSLLKSRAYWTTSLTTKSETFTLLCTAGISRLYSVRPTVRPIFSRADFINRPTCPPLVSSSKFFGIWSYEYWRTNWTAAGNISQIIWLRWHLRKWRTGETWLGRPNRDTCRHSQKTIHRMGSTDMQTDPCYTISS